MAAAAAATTTATSAPRRRQRKGTKEEEEEEEEKAASSFVNPLIISRFLSDLPLEPIDEAALRTVISGEGRAGKTKTGGKKQKKEGPSPLTRGIQAAAVARLISAEEYAGLLSKV